MKMTSIADNFQATTPSEHPKKVISTRNKRSQMIKIFIIVLVTAISVVFTIIDVVVTAQSLKQKHKLKENIAHGIEVSLIIHNLQNERSQTSMFLVSKAWNGSSNALKLRKARERTDYSIKLLTDWLYTLPSIHGETIFDSSSFLNEIHYFRLKTDRGNSLMVHEHIKTFSTWIHELISWLTHFTVAEDIQKHADDLFAYHMIVSSKEELELEKIFGTIYYILGGKFTFENITLYSEKRVRAKAFLETALLFSSVVKSNYFSLIKEMNASLWLESIELKRKYLTSNGVTNSSTNDAMDWFNLMTKYGDLMLQLEVNDANRIESHVNDVIKSNILWLIIRSLLVCFAVIAVPFIILSLLRVENEFYKYAHSLHHKVGLEQSRTDFLMRENARHVEDLASRWKQFSQTNSPDGHLSENSVQPKV